MDKAIIISILVGVILIISIIILMVYYYKFREIDKKITSFEEEIDDIENEEEIKDLENKENISLQMSESKQIHDVINKQKLDKITTEAFQQGLENVVKTAVQNGNLRGTEVVLKIEKPLNKKQKQKQKVQQQQQQSTKKRENKKQSQSKNTKKNKKKKKKQKQASKKKKKRDNKRKKDDEDDNFIDSSDLSLEQQKKIEELKLIYGEDYDEKEIDKENTKGYKLKGMHESFIVNPKSKLPHYLSKLKELKEKEASGSLLNSHFGSNSRKLKSDHRLKERGKIISADKKQKKIKAKKLKIIQNLQRQQEEFVEGDALVEFAYEALDDYLDDIKK